MVYIITGGPGFGKTTLINLLEGRGYKVGGEVAREIIEYETERGSNVLPWKDSDAFGEKVTNARLGFLNNIDQDETAFSDRGLPDQAAYSVYKGKAVSSGLKEILRLNRYADKVFITPPWEEIYANDHIRNETFDEARLIHSCIVETYRSYGYRLIELPLTTPEKRVDFILNELRIEN